MRAIKILFMVSIVIIVLAAALFFFSWNNYNSVNAPEIESKPDYAEIDSCIFNGRYMSVRGWALTDMNPKARVRLFAKKSDSDEWIKLNYSIQNRPDVSSFFGSNGMYDKVGFNASVMNIKTLGGLSGQIELAMEDKNGKIRGIIYDCK